MAKLFRVLSVFVLTITLIGSRLRAEDQYINTTVTENSGDVGEEDSEYRAYTKVNGAGFGAWVIAPTDPIEMMGNAPVVISGTIEYWATPAGGATLAAQVDFEFTVKLYKYNSSTSSWDFVEQWVRNEPLPTYNTSTDPPNGHKGDNFVQGVNGGCSAGSYRVQIDVKVQDTNYEAETTWHSYSLVGDGSTYVLEFYVREEETCP